MYLANNKYLSLVSEVMDIYNKSDLTINKIRKIYRPFHKARLNVVHPLEE